MVTGPVAKFVKHFMRRQAGTAMGARSVQGRIAGLSSQLDTRTLDLRAYARCVVPPRAQHLLLPQDRPPYIDLSRQLFRMQKAIGGSWSEALHVDLELQQLANVWATQRGLPSPRVCPFCLGAAGTPRHVIMACAEVSHLVDQVRDVVENEVARLAPTAELLRAAAAQAQGSASAGQLGPMVDAVRPEHATRWPVLTAWQWLVPVPSKERRIAAASLHSSQGTASMGAQAMWHIAGPCQGHWHSRFAAIVLALILVVAAVMLTAAMVKSTLQ